MINNPENGSNPEIRDTEVDPVRDTQKGTAVAEPDAETSQPGETRSEQPSASSLERSPRSVPSMTEPAPTAPALATESTMSAEDPLKTDAVGEAHFSSELAKFHQRFEEIQAEFIGEPRAAVEKAETLIDGLMNALQGQLHGIHSNVESATDTEHLRVAMLGYRELFDSLKGHRAA